MKEQKPTNIDLFVMTTTLTELVATAIEENRQLWMNAGEPFTTERTEKIEGLIRETSKLYKRMQDLLLKGMDSVEEAHKATAKKEEQGNDN